MSLTHLLLTVLQLKNAKAALAYCCRGGVICEAHLCFHQGNSSTCDYPGLTVVSHMWQGERTVKLRAWSGTTTLPDWPEATLIKIAIKTYSNYRFGFSAFTCGINRPKFQITLKKRAVTDFIFFFCCVYTYFLILSLTFNFVYIEWQALIKHQTFTILHPHRKAHLRYHYSRHSH